MNDLQETEHGDEEGAEADGSVGRDIETTGIALRRSTGGRTRGASACSGRVYLGRASEGSLDDTVRSRFGLESVAVVGDVTS